MKVEVRAEVNERKEEGGEGKGVIPSSFQIRLHVSPKALYELRNSVRIG